MPDQSWRKPPAMGTLSYLSDFDWSSLPEDIKVEILFRMPDKPLTKFKLVSKYFYLLISTACDPLISSPSPYASFCGLFYTAINLRLSKNCLQILPWREYCLEYHMTGFHGLDRPRLLGSYPAFLPFEHTPEDIQDCCNGLFLLAHFGSVPTEYYVCNPTTCECIPIPINPFHLNNNNNNFESYFASLAFDPTDSPCSFKIVRRPARVSQSGLLKLDVFSYSNGNWATHNLLLEHALQGFDLLERSVYLDGVLYLLSLAKFLFCLHISVKHETNMTYRAITLSAKDEFNDCGSLGVVRGHLVYCNVDQSKILVWLLEDGVGWILQHTISLIELLKHPVSHWMLRSETIKVYGFDCKTGEIFFGSSSIVQSYCPQRKMLGLRVHLSAHRIVHAQYTMFPYSRCTIIFNRVIPSSTQSDMGKPACGF